MNAREMLTLMCPASDFDAIHAAMERSLSLYALFFPLDRLVVGFWPDRPPRVVVLAEDARP